MITRKLILIAAIAIGCSAAQGEEPDLNKAFQSEYLYLVSQKEALQRQKQTMEKSFAARTEQAKAKVTGLQKDVVRLAAANDQAHETLLQLEKQKRDLEKRGSTLEATFKRQAKTLLEAERGLKFDTNKDAADVTVPAGLKMSDFSPLFAKANALLEASSSQETSSTSYLDIDGRLAQGSVTRIGRVAAFLKHSDQPYVMGPSGNGSLKVLEKEPSKSVYFFESLNETNRMQKAATWVESLADFSPLLFLGLMLLLVAGLFSALIKV